MRTLLGTIESVGMDLRLSSSSNCQRDVCECVYTYIRSQTNNICMYRVHCLFTIYCIHNLPAYCTYIPQNNVIMLLCIIDNVYIKLYIYICMYVFKCACKYKHICLYT